MALTGTFIVPRSHVVCPDAYVIIDDIRVDRVNKRINFFFVVYFDEATRHATDADPVAKVQVSVGCEPQHPQWQRYVQAIRLATAELDAARLAAINGMADPDESRRMTQKSADDLIATAQAGLDKVLAMRDKALGDDWRERHPSYDDFVSQEIDESSKDPGAIVAALGYAFGPAYIPAFKGFVRA